jgi:hypothetical protein
MKGELIRPVPIIFKGTGKRTNNQELIYYKELKEVVILFQPKAWIDRHLEKQVLTCPYPVVHFLLVQVYEKQLIPYVKRLERLFVEAGKPFPGCVIFQDRGPGHDDRSSLFILLHFLTHSPPIFSPPSSRVATF